MQYENEGDAVSERTRSQQLQLWLRDVLGIEKDKRVDEWMTITSSSAALASGFLADRVVWVDGRWEVTSFGGFVSNRAGKRGKCSNRRPPTLEWEVTVSENSP